MFSRPFKPLTIRKHGLEDEPPATETRPLKCPKLSTQLLPVSVFNEEASISPTLHRNHGLKPGETPLKPIVNPPSPAQFHNENGSASIESYYSVLWYVQ
jgi:hypothetical protein